MARFHIDDRLRKNLEYNKLKGKNTNKAGLELRIFPTVVEK